MAQDELDDPTALVRAVADARARTLALVADLDDEQLMGPRVATVNPLRWEVGHVGWFQERWALRRDGGPAIREDADAIYDSIAVPHSLRWDLPLPGREQTLRYIEAVRARVEALLVSGRATPRDLYHCRYVVGHEDMHAEAFVYGRQTLGYPAPSFCQATDRNEGALHGDVVVDPGEYTLGAGPASAFAFDNEKWSHPATLERFSIARAPVTQAEFREFVDDGGYSNDMLWSAAGRAWKVVESAQHPVYWRSGPDGWQRRQFDRWVELEPHHPMVHVSYYEAEAWCAWAGRRLPTEAQWEVAASFDPTAGVQRTYPWGERPPSATDANLDGAYAHCCDVAAFPAGDSALGCRQMIGNVWEWTAQWFTPYPGFVSDPYREYSQPWFYSHRVLRGGAFMTRGRLLRNTYRNYAVPTRRDLFAGFRTCALDG